MSVVCTDDGLFIPLLLICYKIHKTISTLTTQHKDFKIHAYVIVFVGGQTFRHCQTFRHLGDKHLGSTDKTYRQHLILNDTLSRLRFQPVNITE